MAILNEVYVGRLPEINQMVNDIHNIRKTIPRNAQIKILEKHIEEMWGFKAFCISLFKSNIEDIKTFHAGLSVDLNIKSYIKYTDQGYKFSKDSNICAEVFINSRLLDDSKLTDEEIFSLLLHEIGHSFVERSNLINYMYQCQNEYNIQTNINILKQDIKDHCLKNIPSDISKIIKSHNLYRLQNIKLKKLIKNIPGIPYLKLNIEELKTEKQKNSKFKIPHYSKSDISNAKKEKKNTLKNLDYELSNTGYAQFRSEERLADDFAAMYGMSIYLASALIKLGNPYHYDKEYDSKFNDIDKQVIAIYNSISELQLDHPSDCDRLLAMIDGLEEDYKTLKVDPRIKTELKKDVKSLKKLKNDIKHDSGIIQEFEKHTKNQYQKSIMKNTETDTEKLFNNREQINNDYYNKKEK